jgi:DNA-binding transcriptional LysR family regulator
VELHQLQCFIAVLEEGGFKRATARLGITQPALSYQIRRLEEELGVQVFHRGPGGITPTEAGRTLLQHAHQVIAAVAEAHQAVRELSGGVTGELRIGTIKCVGIYFLPQVLWEIRAKHPMVRPKLLYRDSDEILESLLAKQLDVALVVDPPPDKRLEQHNVFEESISLVSGPKHPFYGRSAVDVKELEEVQFVSLSPQTSTGALIRNYVDRLGLHIVPSISTDNVETVKRMVEEGMGVAFLPDMVTEEDVGTNGKQGRLARSTVEPTLSLPLVLVTWKDAHRSLPLDAFVEEVLRMGRTWDGRRGQPAAEGEPDDWMGGLI